MPQELKPCPYCGSAARMVHEEAGDTAFYFVGCSDCGMYGPTEAITPQDAVTAWNALPRALVWTTEPPAFGEWNWWRLGPNDENRPYCRYVYTDGTIDNTMIGRINWQDIGGQWTGPIPAPQEPAL